MRFFGACLLGALVVVLTVGGIVHVITHHLREPHILAQEFKAAKKECTFFTLKESAAVFGSAPTGGDTNVPGNYGAGGERCEFTIPYDGHVLRAYMGYACRTAAVSNDWQSDEDWGSESAVHRVKGAVSDASAWQDGLIHQAAERFRARTLRMVWISYYDSAWIPSSATTIHFLTRTRSHVSAIAC